MLPISSAPAVGVLARRARQRGAGQRIVLVAEDDGSGEVLGTGRWRGPRRRTSRTGPTSPSRWSGQRPETRVVQDAPVRAAERGAMAAGRTLLVLDTGTEEAARVALRAHRLATCRGHPAFARWLGGGYLDTIALDRDLEADPPAEAPVGRPTAGTDYRLRRCG